MPTLQFAGNSLQTANIVTSDIDHMSGPEKEFDALPIAHGNKSHIPNYNYTGKVITLTGTLNASSLSAMDSLIDTFKGYFVGKDKNLDIEYAGSTRRYVGTARTPRITRPGGLMYAEFEVPVVCTIPFGKDTTTTNLLTTAAVTTSPGNHSITVGGNAEFQYPIITITLNSGTGLTNASISVGNNDNGQVLTVTRTWVAGDELVIDPYEESVTVNGTEVDFSGAMPIFGTGSQSVSYSDTFLTRNYDIAIDQYRYWL